MLYANYIRNKMHHLVKSVFASGYPLKIISKFKKKAVNYTIHGKTEIGKNLIPYPYMYTTRTVNGVTYTDNGDGSVTVSGTATGYSDFFFKIMSIAPNTTFTFSKNQSDDAANVAFTLRQLDENRALIGTEISLVPTVATHTFTTAENARYIQIACKRYANAECKGTYKPMLELGDTATEYEKYTVYGVGDKTNTDYEPYGYKIPLVNSGKNLIPYPYSQTTKTVNGVTFTDNGDGTITVSGTATADAWYYIKTVGANFKPDSSTLYCSGCPAGGSSTSYKLSTKAFKQTSTGYTYVVGAVDAGNGAVLDLNNKEYSQLEISVGVFSGTTVNNVVFKPMLELGNTATDYEPYRAPDTTNVYHNAQLKDGESISYKADGLPELQLYKGENNITADTAVAPSAIDIKYLN